MIKISPSILSADFSRLGEEIVSIDKAGADYIHIDVMDGMYVPNISFGFPIIKAIRKYTDKPFDVHLMIEAPDRYIKGFADAGADIITVHAEAAKHLHRTAQSIHELGKKCGVALNPATSEDALRYIIDDVDLILVMTVNPGFGGQKFISGMTDKIKAVKKLIGDRNIEIEVDGGISSNNINEVTSAGANVIVAGSAVFNAPTPEGEIALMRQRSAL